MLKIFHIKLRERLVLGTLFVLSSTEKHLAAWKNFRQLKANFKLKYFAIVHK